MFFVYSSQKFLIANLGRVAMRSFLILSGMVTLAAVSPSGGGPQLHGKVGEVGLFLPGQIKWTDGPASLPPGAKIALLEGDLSKEGPFVMRLRLPDGYRIPPHVHPKAERLTVISGTFNIGMGDKFDAKAGREMPAGTFGTWSAGMKHFVWSKGETVVQLHGDGPWQIEYVSPLDDPRKAKK